MQILTKFLPATDTKGARIQAIHDGHTVTIGYPHECRVGEEAHWRAVEQILRKLGVPARQFKAIALGDGRFAWVSVGYLDAASVFEVKS